MFENLGANSERGTAPIVVIEFTSCRRSRCANVTGNPRPCRLAGTHDAFGAVVNPSHDGMRIGLRQQESELALATSDFQDTASESTSAQKIGV